MGALMTKMRHCWYCGAELGVIADRHYNRNDTCGKRECEREAQAMLREEREEAHRRLDEDLVW